MPSFFNKIVNKALLWTVKNNWFRASAVLSRYYVPYGNGEFSAREMFFLAMEKGNSAVVKVCLDKGVDPNGGVLAGRITDTPTAITFAVYKARVSRGEERKRYIEIIKSLIKANVITTSLVALSYERDEYNVVCEYYSHFDAMGSMGYGGDGGINRIPAFFYAIREKAVDIVSAMLEANPEIANEPYTFQVNGKYIAKLPIEYANELVMENEKKQAKSSSKIINIDEAVEEISPSYQIRDIISKVLDNSNAKIIASTNTENDPINLQETMKFQKIMQLVSATCEQLKLFDRQIEEKIQQNKKSYFANQDRIKDLEKIQVKNKEKIDALEELVANPEIVDQDKLRRIFFSEFNYLQDYAKITDKPLIAINALHFFQAGRAFYNSVSDTSSRHTNTPPKNNLRH